MPELKWDASLETGNSDIDNDHKYVFCLINTIDAATKCNVHGNVLEKFAELMIMYTSVHFSREQITQKKVGFKESEEHKKLHNQFVARIQAMKISLSETSTDPKTHKASIEKFNDLMKDWWFNHISKEDLKMKNYFKENI
jgi:hemerythrin